KVRSVSAHGEHDRDDGVEQVVHLALAISAALRPERDRADLLDAQRRALLEVPGEPVGELVDLLAVVALAEQVDPIEAVPRGPGEPVQDLLSRPARLGVPDL